MDGPRVIDHRYPWGDMLLTYLNIRKGTKNILVGAKSELCRRFDGVRSDLLRGWGLFKTLLHNTLNICLHMC